MARALELTAPPRPGSRIVPHAAASTASGTWDVEASGRRGVGARLADMVGGVRAGFWIAWNAAVAASAISAVALVRWDDPVVAGWWALGGGALLVGLASASRRVPRPREHVLTGLLDRIVDVAVLAGTTAHALGSSP